MSICYNNALIFSYLVESFGHQEPPPGLIESLTQRYSECLHKLHGSIKRSSNPNRPIRIEEFDSPKMNTDTNSHGRQTLGKFDTNGGRNDMAPDLELKYTEQRTQHKRNRSTLDRIFDTALPENQLFSQNWAKEINGFRNPQTNQPISKPRIWYLNELLQKLRKVQMLEQIRNNLSSSSKQLNYLNK